MYAVVGTNVCILSEKTKFHVNFFNIFPKSTLNTLGVIFACPLRPVSGGGQSVRGVCKNCTPGIRVSAMPVSVPCCRSSSPCPFFCYFCLPADGFSGAVRRFGFTCCPCCRDSRGVVAAAPGAGRTAEESPGLIRPLRRIPCRAVRRPNRRAGCAPWGSGR